MRKIFILFALASTLLGSYGCKKSANDTDSQQTALEKGTSSVKEVISISSIAVQKTAYQILSAPEKLKAWNMHLQACLESPLFSSEEKALIRETLKIITVDFFESGSKRLNDKDIIILQSKAKTLFTGKKLVIAFSTISNNALGRGYGDGPTTPEDDDFDSGVEGPTCKCSTVSDYCYWGSHCGYGGCGAQTPKGCGWLWNYSCEGGCYQN